MDKLKLYLTFLLLLGCFFSYSQELKKSSKVYDLAHPDPLDYPYVYSVQSDKQVVKVFQSYHDTSLVAIYLPGKDSISFVELNYVAYDTYYHSQKGLATAGLHTRIHDPVSGKEIWSSKQSKVLGRYDQVLLSDDYLICCRSYPFVEFRDTNNYFGIDVYDLAKDSIAFSFFLKEKQLNYLGYFGYQYFEVSENDIYISSPVGDYLYKVSLNDFTTDTLNLGLSNDCYDEILTLLPDSFLVDEGLKAKKIISMVKGERGKESCEYVLGISKKNNNELVLFSSVPGKRNKKVRITVIDLNGFKVKSSKLRRIAKMPSPYYSQALILFGDKLYMAELNEDDSNYNYKLVEYFWE